MITAWAHPIGCKASHTMGWVLVKGGPEPSPLKDEPKAIFQGNIVSTLQHRERKKERKQTPHNMKSQVSSLQSIVNKRERERI